MAFVFSQLSLTLLHIMLLSSFSYSRTLLQESETYCDKTLYPSFCKSILAKYPSATTIQDYSRHCISDALSFANNFNSLVNQHLQNDQPNTYALQDCQFLANVNIGLISSALDAIKSSNSLDKDNAEDVQTMLSAIMTNLYTCSDGVQFALPGSSVAQDLSPHFSNSTMLFSLSLSLFSRGWGLLDLSLFNFNRNSNPLGLPLNLGHLIKGLISGKSTDWKRALYELGLRGIAVNTMVIVNPDGSGDYTTINDAVAAAPDNTQANSGYFGIYVVAGVYQEYVNIPISKQYLLMVGDGINQTIITGNRSVGAGWTTFNSSTFAVNAKGFVAVDITFQNTAGAIMHQAVAVRNGADLSAFYRCSFEAYQDTLYTHSMRQFYRECDIYGTVDFIFGNAAVVLQDCNIYPRQPMKGQFIAITAQGRSDPNQNTGTSIHHCNIRPTNDLASSDFAVQTYLGRPWKQYSRTVYMQSYMDSFINPAGWHEWNGTFALDTLYYAEFNNIGPGSDTSKRVTWTGYHKVQNAVDVSNFTVSNFIEGDYWLPSTGVPYNGGFY